MIINHAHRLLDFIVGLKMKGMKNDDIVWELANNFNLNHDEPEECPICETGMFTGVCGGCGYDQKLKPNRP